MNSIPSRRSKRLASAAINITPLVDVLLILLAVLMLAMPLYVKRLPVNLPQTVLGGTPTPMVSLSVALKADGKLMVDGVVAEAEAVLQRITSRTTVELAVDKEVRYDDLAQFIGKVEGRAPKDIVLLTR